MKRIALALATSVAALSMAAVTTFATWTDTVTVTNNVITTGTVDLQVSTNNYPIAGTWNSTTASSTMILANLVPGAVATSGYSFSLWNNSTGVTTMNLTGQITSTSISPTAGVDKSKLLIQLFRAGTATAESAELPLTTWEAGAQALTTSLVTAATRDYDVHARLDTTADNTWQGQNVTFTMTVVGSQP